VAASGRTTELKTTGAAALGAADGRFPTATHQLAPGDIALLYTDGLVERPGRTPAQGTAELMQAVADATTGPTTGEPIVDRICRETLEVLTRSSGYRDDVAVLAVQRVGATAPLHLVLPAVPDATRAARADLGEWLARLHVTALDDLSVRHAISELVANAVDHAYDDPGVDDQVRVDARLRPDGVLEAQVADDGAWREPAVTGQARGRGLAIVAGFVDELQLNRGPAGTRATVRHRLRRPAMMLRGYVEERAGAPGPPEFRVHVDDTRLRASGHVGDEAALKLQRLLDRCSQGGTRPIEVDLADVSLLGSAGVQVLVEARAAGEVRLFAPRGSAAQHVLDLVQVPYES
jgi:anti-sigma regulatory factor (Ser/Thr protein kinase)/anti-anti-sigma regulatory factor